MLAECLNAARASGADYVLLVSPVELSLEIRNLADQVIPDPGLGLAEAINFGMNNLPADILYSTWIGDDDLFANGGLQILRNKLERNSKLSLVYGKCIYINSVGGKIGVNQTGQLAATILGFGPDLIPQPSSLFRLDDFKRLDGLDSKYKNAFDFDLFLKLKKIGKLEYVPEMISYFRWHDDSLSVNQRWRAVKEASKVRRSHLKLSGKAFSIVWEPTIVLATFIAGKMISSRSKLMTTSQ
jgi:hypothetical protein